MKIRVAVTGGIGSGKSTVMKTIASLGFPCFSCDEIYREMLSAVEYANAVQKLFPDCVKNGAIEKGRLAKRVFQNQNDLKKLNELAHPLVLKRLEEKLSSCLGKYVFVEVPLLFESEWSDLFDAVFVVLRPLSQRIQAVQRRDGLSEEEIRLRIQNQFHYDDAVQAGLFEKENIYRIENDGDETALANVVKKRIHELAI